MPSRQPILHILAGIGLLATSASADVFGGFAPSVWTALSQQNARRVAIADMNRDGRQDALFLSNAGVSILYNDGAGGLGNEVFHPKLASTSDASIVVADFNADGWPDFATTMGFGFGNRFSVWLSDGHGNFHPRTDYWGSPADVRPSRSLNVADLDHDGDLDLALVDHGAVGTPVRLYFNDGNGHFTNTSNVIVPVDTAAFASALGDLNADGNADLTIVIENHRNGEGSIAVWLGDGDGGFGPPTLFDAVSAAHAQDLVIADVDLDGHPDLVISANGVHVMLNDGHGSFLPASSHPLPGNLRSHQLAVADVDADVYPDIAVGAMSGSPEAVALLRSLGDGLFAPPVLYAGTGTGEVNSLGVALADMDGNGTPDLVFSTVHVPVDYAFANVRLNQTEAGPPGAFALTIPAQDATDLALPEHVAGWDLPRPRFRWEPAAGFVTTYDLVVMTAGAPYTVLYSAHGLQTTTHPVPPLVLVPGAEYFWHVTASNTMGATHATQTHRFTTVDLPRHCDADIDGNGTLDIFDVLEYVNLYQAGCGER